MNPSSQDRGASLLRENASPALAVASSSDQISTPRRLGVLGIAMIVEEVGKGARLVFRYPASPPPSFLDRSHHATEGESNGKGGSGHHPTARGGGIKSPKNATKNKNNPSAAAAGSSSDNSNGVASGDNIDLFFDLPARVISKLFRPKRPLCGQPLTLNVSGTTFCCRAELFDSQPSTIGGGEGPTHPLVLFSVIVALAPVASSPYATTEETMSLPSHPTHYPFDFNATFTTVRSVHRNLAKICRVLTREELRCRYVSRQCTMLLQIRKDYESRLSLDSVSLSAGSDCSGGNNGTMSTAIVGGDNTISSSKKDTANAQPPPPISPKSTPKVKDTKKSKKTSAPDDDENVDRPEMNREERRQYVQTLIEIMLAASPPADNSSGATDEQFDRKDQQHGNLARELAQIFHWISSPSTTQACLSRVTAQEGVVYINRHIAVPLEPVAPMKAPQMQQHCIRPYHTVLFPNSSPSEVLNGLMDGVNEMTTSPSISHSLRRILPHIQPRKSLIEISWDAGLSLPHVMSAAKWLVHSGTCVAAMPVLRKNRYACVEGAQARLASLALPFWQTFAMKSQQVKFYWGGGVACTSSDIDDDTTRRRRRATTGVPHIFIIVSALTTRPESGSVQTMQNMSALPTLGECLDLLSGVDEPTVDDFSPPYSETRRIQRRASSNNLN
ncbi:hypothetical protein ACHAXR_007974, partial [Thalassiosira sp. AJA248-18]